MAVGGAQTPLLQELTAMTTPTSVEPDRVFYERKLSHLYQVNFMVMKTYRSVNLYGELGASMKFVSISREAEHRTLSIGRDRAQSNGGENSGDFHGWLSKKARSVVKWPHSTLAFYTNY